MKRILLLIFTLISLNAFSQLQVKEGSFRYVPGGVIDNKTEYTDGNDLPMALIKISTENINEQERLRLVFTGNRATQIIKKPKTGEMWIYISADAATFINIKHPDYGTYKYYLPEELCDYCVYEMVLQYIDTTHEYGFLAISSEPDGADIYIDGKHYGKTNDVVNDLTEGTHALKLVKEGYSELNKNITITKGETLKLKEKLQDINSQRTYLIVKADQANAMIYIDDKPVNTGEASVSVMIGTTHTYKIEYNLYHTETGSVTINERTTIEKQLRPAFGYLNISTTPKDAKVFVDGEYIGQSPIKTDKIKSGTHTVRVMKESYNMTEQSFIVNDGQTTNATLDMTGNFVTLTVEVDSDTDSYIYVDDEYKGKGKWTGNLSDGTHLLEARKQNHKPSKKNVNLVLGKNETITLEAPAPIVGSIDINTSPLGANIYIDEKHYGETPNFINNIKIGKHKLTLVKQGYNTITKTIDIKEGETLSLNEKMMNGTSSDVKTEKVQKVKVKEKTIVEKTTFVGLNVAYSVAPEISYGLTLGRLGKIGWYLNAMSNFNFDAMGSEYECDEHGRIDGDIVFYNGETSSTRISVGAGALFRLAKPVYLKAGVGYGLRDIAWQDVEAKWIRNTYYSYKGLEFDAGMMFSFGKMNASLDGVVNMGGENGPSLELKLGLGINF